MSSTPDPLAPRSSPLCKACGASLKQGRDGDTAQVCLRCAGERILAMLDGTPSQLNESSEPLSDDLPSSIGPYEILEEIGRGGMGRVLLARHQQLGRVVALKVLPEARAVAGGLELRFQREVQTIARLRHRGIVTIHESGRTGGYLYFSMDYVEGGDLAKALRTGRLPWRRAVAWVRDLAQALAYAHTEGVLHRDLKPSNILLDGDQVLLADFGLASQIETGGDLTVATTVLGTPHYMAPEVLERGTAASSVASDVYALGVVLFEALSGVTPRAHCTSTAELALSFRREDVSSPRLRAPEISRDLETVCLKALDTDPRRRYATAAAFEQDLSRVLAGLSVSARPVPSWERAWRWSLRHPGWAASGLAVVLLAIGSTWAALEISASQRRTEAALHRATEAEEQAQDHLREAKLSEARALSHTELQGRRLDALRALGQAAQGWKGDLLPLRNEAMSALLLTDVEAIDHWDLGLGGPTQVSPAPGGVVLSTEARLIDGGRRQTPLLRKWGEPAEKAIALTCDAPSVSALRFSRDGSKAMMRYADNAFRVWNTADGKLLLTLSGRPRPGAQDSALNFNDDFDFSPDGSLVAAGLAEGGVSWNRVSDGAEVRRWVSPVRVQALRYSPDGYGVACAVVSRFDVREAWVIEAATGAERRLPQPESVSSLAWSSTGRHLYVATGDNAIGAFNPHTGALETRFPLGATDIMEVMALDDEGLAAVRGESTTFHLVDVFQGRHELHLGDNGPNPMGPPSLRKDFVTCTLANVATHWQVLPPVGLHRLPPPDPSRFAYPGAAGSFDISPNGRWVATAHGRRVLVRELETGVVATEWEYPESSELEMATLCFENDSTHLQVCSVASGLERFELVAKGGSDYALERREAVDADKGYVLVTYSEKRDRLVLLRFRDGSVKVRSVGPDRLLSTWVDEGAYSAALSPQEDRVLVNATGQGPRGALHRLRLHEVGEGKLLRELEAPVSCDAAWSRDGTTVLTSNGPKKSVLWDTATWTARHVWEGELGGDGTTFALAPRSDYAVVTHDDRLHLVSLQTGKELLGFELSGASGLALAVRFLPDGNRFAVLWLNGRVDVVNVAEIRAELARHQLDW